MQALNAAGQQVSATGWLSSNPNVVSLSTSDPPVLTALAPGRVTISAGSVTADVTVSAGSLQPGTVRWSSPGNVASIIRAVPSATGVADVFALHADGTVQAFTRDGLIAWTANAGQYGSRPAIVVADFQGGAVIRNDAGIFRLDGLTGQPSPLYSAPAGFALDGKLGVHPDGTIFAVESNNEENSQRFDERRVVGIDPATGARKFVVSLQDYEPYYGDSGPRNACNGGPATFYPTGGVTHFTVAGDGFAYVAYSNPEIFIDCARHGSYITSSHLKLLRLASDGTFTEITIQDAPAPAGAFAWATGFSTDVITNRDTGTLLSWEVWFSGDGQGYGVHYGTAVTSGTALSVVSTSPVISGQSGPPELMLQLQDGSFAGKVTMDDFSSRMVGVSNSGSLLWSVPDETPLLATADGGLVSESGTTYDQYGAPTGQIAPVITSWRGNAYRIGSVEQLVASSINLGLSWLPFQGTNRAGIRLPARFPVDSVTNAKVDKILDLTWPRFARSNCQAVLPFAIVNYNLGQVQNKQIRTNFYDISDPKVAELKLH